jgi:hypothetical protein
MPNPSTAKVRSGNGGTVVTNGVPIVVSKWTRKWSSRLTENTNSSTVGYTNYDHVVYEVTWTIEGPWDESNTPDEAAGLIPGSKITINFGYGGGSAFVDELAYTSVEEVEIVDDEKEDIVRFTANGKGGFWIQEEG